MVRYKVIYTNETWSQHDSMDEMITTVRKNEEMGLKVKTAFHIVETEFTNVELELFFGKENKKDRQLKLNFKD